MQSDHQAYLEYSSGPWKKHKYFKKIGEGANAVYKYAKSVPGKVEDAVDNARWDAEEKIYNANEKLKEKSGKNARDRWQEEERRLNSARELDKDFREGDKKWFESDTSKARSTREIANEKKAVRQRNQMQAEYISNRRATARGAKQIYDQTAMGKAESALNKMKSRVAKAKKKLKHDGMDDYVATVEYGEALIDEMLGRDDSLEHSYKGKYWKTHKYIEKKLVNGKWRYYYGTRENEYADTRKDAEFKAREKDYNYTGEGEDHKHFDQRERADRKMTEGTDRDSFSNQKELNKYIGERDNKLKADVNEVYGANGMPSDVAKKQRENANERFDQYFRKRAHRSNSGKF